MKDDDSEEEDEGAFLLPTMTTDGGLADLLITFTY